MFLNKKTSGKVLRHFVGDSRLNISVFSRPSQDDRKYQHSFSLGEKRGWILNENENEIGSSKFKSRFPMT